MTGINVFTRHFIKLLRISRRLSRCHSWYIRILMTCFFIEVFCFLLRDSASHLSADRIVSFLVESDGSSVGNFSEIGGPK